MNNMSINRKIIVIDDQESIHEDFKIIFNEESKDREVDELENLIFDKSKLDNEVKFLYSIHSAYQGEDGYNMIMEAFRKNEPFHVAFVDMRMPPGWDGLLTIENILKNEPNIQIVICTAYTDYSPKDIEDRIGKSDRVLLIKKPFENVEVILTAKALYEKWQLSQKAHLKMEEMESIIAERTREIEKIQKQLYETSKLSALGELSSGVAHEINNPLAIINGNVFLIEDNLNKRNQLTNDFKDFISVIYKNIKRITSIISHLKFISSKEEFELQENLNINDVLLSSFELFYNQLEEEKIKVITKLHPNELIVNGNKASFEQAIINLISNARDALKKDSKNSPKEITVSSFNKNGKAVIYFEDSANSINSSVRDTIFEPFVTTKDVNEGSGLGLSITYGIITKYGGTIYLDDTAKDKTRFVIELRSVK